MILLNYWTSEHYEKNIWDRYYCKNLTSAKKQLKKLLNNDWLNETQIKHFIDKFSLRQLDNKTCFSVWCYQEKLESEDLFIMIEKINLI